MKLYEVPRNSKIKLVDAHPDRKEEVYNFDHIDGMYSYCTDKNNVPCHFAAWTEVEVVND
jgi:hypothetical protein